VTADARRAIEQLRATGKAVNDLDHTGSRVGRTFSRGFGLAVKGAAIGAAAGFGALALAAKAGFDEFADAQRVTAQTTAVLKSTGGAANVTKTQILDLAQAISRKTGIDDQAVQSTENLLLTFTSIRNEVGKGNDIFTQATKITQDMSVALGEDGKSAAIQLGKALQDPIKGVTALRRVGVNFNQSQVDTIKKMVETGHTMDAQKFILRELNKEFSGSAEAYGRTLPGALSKLKNAFDDLAAKAITPLIPYVTKAVEWFSKLFVTLSDGGASTGRISQAMGIVKNVIAGLQSAAQVVVEWFRAHWGDIQRTVVEVGRALAPPIRNLEGIIVGIVGFIQAHWNRIGPIVEAQFIS
jgi:hypothetical protein